MKIRKYTEADCDEITDLFFNTVHSVNKSDYSTQQLNAWATGNIDQAKWNNSFLKHYTLVAEIDGKIVGFGDLDSTYLDRLYVHKDYQRQGIASAILDCLEQYARQAGKSEMTTHASITAKPFFEKRGYHTIKEQQVMRNSVLLTNFVMKKHLLK